MTLDIATPSASYTVQGTGPYAILWPYAVGAVRAAVIKDGVRTVLTTPADFTFTPDETPLAGNLFLSAGAAATYANARLIIFRRTAAEQGWDGIAGEREAGLELQLDLLAMSQQEYAADADRTLRADEPLEPFVPQPDRVLMFDSLKRPVAGPTAADIAGAQSAAATAVAAKTEAEAARDEAVNKAVFDMGAWIGGGILYPKGALVQPGDGRTWIANAAHLSAAAFATDQVAGLWRIFADKGVAGAGAGDVLAANNGAEYSASAGVFRANTFTMLGLSTRTSGALSSLRSTTIYSLGSTSITGLPAGATGDGEAWIVGAKDDNNSVGLYLRKTGSLAFKARIGGVEGAFVEQATQAWVNAAIAAALTSSGWTDVETLAMAGVATRDTADFVAGYDYELEWEDVRHNAGAQRRHTVSAFRVTANAWATAAAISSEVNSGGMYGRARLEFPRTSRKQHLFQGDLVERSEATGVAFSAITGADTSYGRVTFHHAAADQILKLRIGLNGTGNFTGGTITVRRKPF